MAKNKSGQTAFGAALARLIEQYQPDNLRLFEDNLLQHLLPRSVVIFTRVKFIRTWMINLFDKKTKGILGGLICRTKYIDEITTSFINGDIQQILILGSGMDTRPYRLEGIKQLKVFEVDMASVQDFKIKKIKKYFGALHSNVNYIPIDFNSQTLSEVLKLHQFEFSKPAFIIWEGVTQYITKDAVEKTLDFISATAPGSHLVFTYILESVIMKQSSIPGANELMKYFEKKNAAWQFGIEPVKLGELLEKYHLQLFSDIDSDYYQEKYLQPMGRELDTTKMERVAFAKRYD
ncbi:MAG TPA: SAM-dependent methyltransferase [Hanamia sp.]